MGRLSMQPDEKRVKLIFQWLDIAEQDLGVAEHLLGEVSPYLIAVSYHSQQAAEKYLKALIVFLGTDPPITHDLDLLLEIISPMQPEIYKELGDYDPDKVRCSGSIPIGYASGIS
jgi:HEPN domain-containing protein